MKTRTSGVFRWVVHVFQDGTLVGLSDREILGRFVEDRDEAAFGVLLARHGPMVLNVCRQVVRDPDDAEDAFQATFLALACKASGLKIGDSLGPWLYRVASRVAARARAERRRRGDRERSGRPIPEPESVPGGCSDPDEIPRVVHEELARLPERLRAPIVLCYLEGMTHERAAHHLGCPVGTVRSRLARARALLHGRIARRGLVMTTATLGAVLAPGAPASAVSPTIPMSLIKTAARIAGGTAPVSEACRVSARVAILLEGVLKMFRVKQFVGSMAALAVIGGMATFSALSAFSASGPTGADEVRVGPDRTPPPLETSEKPDPSIIAKTYYVGDLVLPRISAGPPGESAQPGALAGDRRWVDMEPLIDLITSTVARGTWTILDGHARPQLANVDDGKHAETTNGGVTRRTIGSIQPYFLSVSLIVRQTAEGHDEVANLLRKLRRLLHSGDEPGGTAQAASQVPAPAGRQEPNSPVSAPPPDHNARIHHLLDELRQEIDSLPGIQNRR